MADLRPQPGGHEVDRGALPPTMNGFPPPQREFDNTPSALEHRQIVSGAVVEMLAADVVTALPQGLNPQW